MVFPSAVIQLHRLETRRRGSPEDEALFIIDLREKEEGGGGGAERERY